MISFISPPVDRIFVGISREPISSANPKFKIKNPRVSASRNRGTHPAPAWSGFRTFIPSHIKTLRSSARFTETERSRAAFTLVELLAVIGIMGLLAAVGVPALKGLTGSGGRKQALSQLMGALEIARNTAISSGTNAAVIFPDSSFASGDAYKYRSMAVVAWNPTNTNGTNTMVGSWIVLPQGVVLHHVQINQLPLITNTTTLRIPPSTNSVDINKNKLRAVVFQSNGGIEESYYTNTLTTEGISFYEGAVVENFTKTTNTSKQTNNAETIKMTHYTGRTIPTLAKPKP